MAVVVGEAAVRLRPETSGFAREAEDEVDGKLPGIAGKAAGYFAAAFAAVGIGAFLGNAITQASDLGESASKVGVVFGAAGDQVKAFAANASTSLGLSEAAALGATGTFGNLLRSVGLSEQASADMSTSMLQLAGDLASFNNSSPEEALDALRSGLVGETEPLKQFGINMNEAALSAKAVELGLADQGETLDANAKAQAAYALIMEQTALAQGDFARTSAGLANQQRIAKAQFQDLSADIGGLFVPALGNAAGMVTGTLLPGLLNLTDNLPAVGTALGSLGDYVRAGFDATDTAGLAEASGTITERLQLAAVEAGNFGAIFGEAMADGAAGSELLGQGSLAGLAVTLGDLVAQVRDALGPAFLAIGDAIGPALDQVTGAFGDAFGGGGGGGILGVVVSALEFVGPLIADYIGRWLPVIEAIIPIVADVLSALAPVIADLVGQIGPVLQQLLPIVSQVAGVFASTLLTVIQALAPVIPPLVAAIGQVAGQLAGAFLSAIQAIAPVLPVIAGVIGQVAGMLAGALATAIQALIPILPPIIEAFSQIALVLVGVLMEALSAILPIIPTLVEALLALVQAAILPLLPLLPILADLLMTIITALAPLIPPIIQLVALIVQLAVAAIMPLMPLIPIVIGLFTLLLNILMPVIQVVIGIVAAFIGMAATVASVVIGFVSTVIGVFTSFWSGVTGIVSRIVSGTIGGFQGLKDGVVGIFTGIADFVGGIFSGIGTAIKTAINGIISAINNVTIRGINLIIDGLNIVNPFDDIPHVPKIPTFHTGGVFDSGSSSGEGLALLRDDELIATPEQRRVANDLLRSLLAGDLPGDTVGQRGTVGGRGGVQVTNNITQLPGESGAAFAARASQQTVWNLNGGITRPVTVGAAP